MGDAASAFSLLATLIVAYAARLILAPRLLRARDSGTLTSRRAAWLYGALVACPYLAILIFFVLTDAGSVWVLVLLMALTLPVVLLPWWAIFVRPDGFQSRRPK